MDQPACSPLRLAAALRSVAITALALAILMPSAALAQSPAGTGGATPTQTPVPAVAASAAAPRPVVDAITCRTGCLGISRATPGSVVRISGEGMATVASVILLGRRGYRDDVTVAAAPVTPTAVEITLPPNARGGPVVEAKVQTRKLLFDGGRKATVSFYVRGVAPVDVAVDVVRASDRMAVAHFAVPAVAPGSVQSVDWDGTIAGVAQPDGRYVFQVAAAIAGGAGGVRAAQVSAPAPRRESFWLVHDVVPIAGPHTYGQGFGVQRAGHTHQGQDVMADCGLPLLATQAGEVKFAGSQALAGNYVVLSAADGSADYVYMHLRDPALVKKGDPVVTGQPIGFVGRTGDATACHLHFEMWPAPGWYTGGAAVDPLPSLTAWDVAS